MPDGPAIDAVRAALRDREDRDEPADADRDEDRAREMRDRVEATPPDD